LMMWPDFLSIICGIIALDTYKSPLTLMSIIASQSSTSPVLDLDHGRPALLINISIVENFCKLLMASNTRFYL
jgi:hypothetical protein